MRLNTKGVDTKSETSHTANDILRKVKSMYLGSLLLLIMAYYRLKAETHKLL